jgi:glycosyltransferase domain-containing protein
MKEKNDATNKYTIFIPTYNRPVYLKRLLTYFNSYGKGFNIIIADSSPDEIKRINAAEIKEFRAMNIRHLDAYPTTLNPYHKFADMVKYCTTEYAVFCADDDFVVPAGVAQSVHFLEENPDYTCAHGNYFEFKLHPKTKQVYWRPIYPYASITSSDPVARFQMHLETYYQTLYAVHHAQFLQMIFKEFSDSGVDPMQFGELLPDMLSLIYGKMKRIDVFYAARANESRVAYWPTIFEYMQQGVYESEYTKFKHCIAKHLVKNSHLDEQQAKDIIDASMQKYLATARREDSFMQLGTLMKKIRLPRIIDHTMKNIYRKITTPKEYEAWTTTEPKTEDFHKIRTIVLNTGETILKE